jgi:hypothetical protein
MVPVSDGHGLTEPQSLFAYLENIRLAYVAGAFLAAISMCAIGAEFSVAELVQYRFRDDRPRRIAGAEKQDVERVIGHGTPHAVQQAEAAGAASGTQHALACATRASFSPLPSP